MIDADHLYAADSFWWDYHISDIARDFNGKCWSCDPTKDEGRTYSNWAKKNNNPTAWGITILKCMIRQRGLSTDATKVHSGGNSGYQAINLARHLLFANGDTGGQIILIGFDMHNHSGKSHWFGDHPSKFVNNNNEASRFIDAYRTIKPEDYGIEIINCSRTTALDAFPCKRLEDVL